MAGPGDIRIAVSEGRTEVELGGGPFVLFDLGGLPLSTETPTWVRIVAHGAGLEVRGAGAVPLRVPGLRLASPPGGAVRLHARDYAGVLEVQRAAEGLLVVNELPLEAYVAGAVKAEAGDRAPLEMLKAQAVVARTYAAYHRQLNAAKPYHLVASTAHQQFAGRVAGGSPAAIAVCETAGQVLLWEGALFPAFYHTDSGGHTEDPRAVFAASNMPALRPVRVEFRSDSPHHVWSLDVPLTELTAALRRGGVAVGRIVGLDVVERSISLRVTRLAVQGTAGTVVVRGNDLRRLVGYDVLKSTLFAVAVESGVARFAGRGYGHGVGLDQAASRTMAELGYSAPQILAYYYPGAVLVAGLAASR